MIGGGATGAGAGPGCGHPRPVGRAVESRDSPPAPQSRSSKLIHGGLRYLEQQNFGLVREALRERSLLLNVLAPHLVKPVRSSSR